MRAKAIHALCLMSLPRSTIWRRGSMIRRVAVITLRAKGEARSVSKRAPGGPVGAPLAPTGFACGRASNVSGSCRFRKASGATQAYLQFTLTKAMLGRLGRGSTQPVNDIPSPVNFHLLPDVVVKANFLLA